MGWDSKQGILSFLTNLLGKKSSSSSSSQKQPFISFISHQIGAYCESLHISKKHHGLLFYNPPIPAEIKSHIS